MSRSCQKCFRLSALRTLRLLLLKLMRMGEPMTHPPGLSRSPAPPVGGSGGRGTAAHEIATDQPSASRGRVTVVGVPWRGRLHSRHTETPKRGPDTVASLHPRASAILLAGAGVDASAALEAGKAGLRAALKAPEAGVRGLVQPRQHGWQEVRVDGGVVGELRADVLHRGFLLKAGDRDAGTLPGRDAVLQGAVWSRARQRHTTASSARSCSGVGRSCSWEVLRTVLSLILCSSHQARHGRQGPGLPAQATHASPHGSRPGGLRRAQTLFCHPSLLVGLHDPPDRITPHNAPCLPLAAASRTVKPSARFLQRVSPSERATPTPLSVR